MVPLDRRPHLSRGGEEHAAVNLDAGDLDYDVQDPPPPLRRELSVEDLFAPLTRLDVKYLSSSPPSSSSSDPLATYRPDQAPASAPHPRNSAHPETLPSLTPDSIPIPTSFAKSGHAFSVNMATIPEETGMGPSERSSHAADSVSDEAGASGGSKGRSRNKSRCAMSRSPVSGNELLQNSNSDEDQQVVDDRKQRRMLSNRESARRSRLRKQQHLDELQAHVTHLRAQNSQMLSRFNLATQHFAQISEENRQLRSEAMDLSHQLQRLHHIVVANRTNGVRCSNNRSGQVVDGSK